MRIKSSLTFSMVLYFIITLLVIQLKYSPVMVRAQSGNKTTLRIAVAKSSFPQFVKIILDPITDTYNFSGFAFEVFEEAVAVTNMNQSYSFEYHPFIRQDGTMNGSYDDLVKAVFNKDYDGAVGDITIRFLRTFYAGFTAPYADVKISMLIPSRQQTTNKEANALVSLRHEMLIGTIVIFFLSILVFMGVDILDFVFGRTKDHADQPTRPTANGEYQNSIYQPKEREDAWKRELLGTVKGTRLMMLLWFLILLFLITYYATTLISLLPEEHSKASSKTLDQIIRNRERVGFSAGSFVYEVLKGAGVSDNQLLAYHSENDLLDILTKGTKEGGVTVAIDETPPHSIFWAQHCNNFTLVPLPGLQTSGYAFAFRKERSDLIQEVSNGIIKIIENGQLRKIKARTIGADVEPCDVDISSNNAASNYLTTFKACAILCVALLVITYAIFVITTNRRSLRYLYP